MKRIVLTMVMGAFALVSMAQEETNVQEETKVKVREDNRLGWNVSVQGGMLWSHNENTRELSFGDLITAGAAIGVGYDFSHNFGVRAQLGYGRNVSATNPDILGYGLTSYEFNDISLFGDAVFNLSHMCSREMRKNFAVELKGYVGLGCVFADDYDGMKVENMYSVKDNGQTVFAMRCGFITDWHVTQAWSLYGDLGLTGFTDGFNGVNVGTGADLRVSLMMGVAYHF